MSRELLQAQRTISRYDKIVGRTEKVSRFRRKVGKRNPSYPALDFRCPKTALARKWNRRGDTMQVRGPKKKIR